MSLARNWKEKIKKSFNMENTVDKEEKEMTDEVVDQTEDQAEDQKSEEPELTVEEKLLRQNEELKLILCQAPQKYICLSVLLHLKVFLGDLMHFRCY